MTWRGRNERGDIQAAQDKKPNDSHSLRYRHVHSPEPGYRQYQNHQIANNVDRGDCVANKVIVDAVAVGDRSVPIIGERAAMEESGEHQAHPP